VRRGDPPLCSTANDNPTGNNFEPAAINLVGGIALIGECAMWESNLRERNAFYEWTITADDTERRFARALRICVGNEVRKLYGDVPNELIPSEIAALLHRLDQ
jgi:hypothetical protein